MSKILIASKNPHKIEEMQKLLSNYEVLSEKDIGSLPEVEETEDTYEGNAALKAIAYNKISQLPCIADDTGLEVDYLNGAPGVYSARFSGVEGENRYQANNEKLLAKLADVPIDNRTAQFVSVIVFAYQEKVLITVKGVCKGRIIFSPRGKDGFGYDPLFEIPDLKKTFAELGEEKHQISHRGKALTEFKKAFDQLKGNF